MDMGFIWRLSGKGGWELELVGRRGGGASKFVFYLVHSCLGVRMSENSCRSERRGKGKVTEWTLPLGKEARARVWGLGMERESTLHILKLN